MSSNARSIFNIRRTLDSLLAAGNPSPQEIDLIVKKIAPLVLDVLKDVEHPLTKSVQELRQLIRESAVSHHGRSRAIASKQSQRGNATASRAKKKPAIIPQFDWNRLYFSPMPGGSVLQLTKHWKAQLMLLITALVSPHRLVDVLSLSEFSVEKAASFAEQTCIHHWSPLQQCHFLRQAVDFLDFPDAAVSMGSDMRTLQRGGAKVKLSIQEGKMAQLLLASEGEPISHLTFKKAGISYPVRVKSNLLRKCQKAGISFPIAPSPGSYTYGL